MSWSATLITAAKISLPSPLPSREGNKTLSPGGRRKGEGEFKTSDEAQVSPLFTIAVHEYAKLRFSGFSSTDVSRRAGDIDSGLEAK